MSQFFPPPPPPKAPRTSGAVEYRCSACGQRIGLVKRATDVDDKAAVARLKGIGRWRCPGCGGTSLERVTP